MATAANSNRSRPDGRRSLLVYMDEALIKDLKKVAVDEDRNVYEIVEEAARGWLSKRSDGIQKE